MVRVELRTLQCIDTKGEKTEEPYLCVYVDGDLVRRFGPYKMKQGDVEYLRDSYRRKSHRNYSFRRRMGKR